MSRKPSYLYVVEDERGRCKVGHGGSPKRRRASLATGNADALTLAFKVKVDGRTAAEAEAVAHGILDRYRVRGEWFAVSRSVAAAAARMAATGDHHPEIINRMREFDAACSDPTPCSTPEIRRAQCDRTDRAAQAVEDIAPGLLVALNSWNEIHLDYWKKAQAERERERERLSPSRRRRPVLAQGEAP